MSERGKAPILVRLYYPDSHLVVLRLNRLVSNGWLHEKRLLVRYKGTIFTLLRSRRNAAGRHELTFIAASVLVLDHIDHTVLP